MVNKKGWLRVLEASIAILIVTSVVLVAYTKQVKRADPTDQIMILQKKFISEMVNREDLRMLVLSFDSNPETSIAKISVFLNKSFPESFDYCFRICDLGVPCSISEACISRGLDYDSLVKAIKEKEIYAEEAIISANYTKYSPKKIKIFLWEKI